MADTPIRDAVDQVWDMRSALWAGEGFDTLDTIATDLYAAGLAAGRAEEREAILSPPGFDDRHHPDGSIGPDAAPPYGGDAAYWYRRWLFLARRLDEEASERLRAYGNFNDNLADVVRLAEREECALLAEQEAARMDDSNEFDYLPIAAGTLRDFANLIRARSEP